MYKVLATYVANDELYKFLFCEEKHVIVAIKLEVRKYTCSIFV